MNVRIDPYQRLLTNQYLNDNIINDTLWKILHQHPTHSYINTYFYNNLNQYGANDRSTRRGIRKLRENRYTRIYIPICKHNHWYHVQIRYDSKEIHQLDSMNTTAQHFGEQIKPYLLSPQDWTLKYSPMKQQHNGYDCGVYLLAEIKEQITNARAIQGIPSRIKIYEHLHNIQNHTSYCESRILQEDNTEDDYKNIKTNSNTGKPQKDHTSNKDIQKQSHSSNCKQDHGTSKILVKVFQNILRQLVKRIEALLTLEMSIIYALKWLNTFIVNNCWKNC